MIPATSKQIHAGAVLYIEHPNGSGYFVVEDIKDGKVTLSKRHGGPGQWWLPYEYLRQFAEYIGEQGAKDGN